MGTAAYGGRGFKGRTRVSGERPLGAARCSQRSTAIHVGVMPLPHPQARQSRGGM